MTIFHINTNNRFSISSPIPSHPIPFLSFSTSNSIRRRAASPHSPNQASQSMDFPLVIKVKYGETLRRFTASVGANGLLHLNMAQLTDQVRALFNFPPDADLTLTYIDEDNDEVTLVDDNDLHDATRQKLNPLRVQVIKNMVRPARFESTCSLASVVRPRPAQTEVCSDSEASSDSLKEDTTKSLKDLLDNTEKNIDSVKAKPTAAESSTLVGLASHARKPTLMESETQSHKFLPEACDVATKIRIMEDMSKMGETFDKVKSKSMENEEFKPTNDLSDHFSGCPVQNLTNPPAHTAEVVEGEAHPSTNELMQAQSVKNNTLPGVEVEVASEVGTSNPAIESSFLQNELSNNACFVEVDVDYEQMLLDALDGMGFKQVDLNKEVLRKNLFDLGETITDLCDMGEWDELLNELEQMGFSDKEMNMVLLKKNEGNIKDVIMTLISEDVE